MKFKELKLNENILHSIDDLNYLDLTPIQEQSINFLLDGFDVMGEAPTGTGKTLAYALPLIQNLDLTNENIQALVLCPTRELAIQSADEIRKVLTHTENVGVLPIYGGQDIHRQILQLKKRPKIIVGTPGRILDHIERRTIKLDNIKMFVLDECDEMLDMGFAPSVDKIESCIHCEHQSVLFSATISKEIAKISKKYLKNDAKVIRTGQKENESKLIAQYYIDVKEDNKLDTLRMMLDTFSYDSVFVFCRTKRNVDKLQNSLKKLGYKISYLHGDLPQKKRDDNMRAFKSRENKILIATDVAARGIDVSNVDFVVNYSLPDQDEFYLHRIGRTGRANTEGKAFTFINTNQRSMLKVYESLTGDVIKRYSLLSKKEKENMDMKKVLENVKNSIKDSHLEETETLVGETLAEWERSGISCDSAKLAAALLKELVSIKDAQVSKPDDGYVRERKDFSRSKERPSFERSERPERKQFPSNPNAQRFFINIGEVDGLNNKELMNFVSKYVPEIKDSDFSDIYIKNTFSFFELPKDDTSAIMEKINGTTYGSRDVRVELSERKTKETGHSNRSFRGSHPSDRRGSGYHSSHHDRPDGGKSSFHGRSNYSHDNRNKK
ncbi:MAG: DEAD/DEAH box helicase [Bacilli bacterium]|jgi:ATP-dependent RNA helicase DeaD